MISIVPGISLSYFNAAMNSHKSTAIALFGAIVYLSWFSPVKAQELEPRAYVNIPVGLNFVASGYAYTAGGILFDPTIPLDNANIRIHGSLLAYARYTNRVYGR